uniref:Uncharacterized protein n=1 Tax=Salarias fasciatus TaxID=181472 RepID=A0A672JHU9_SALFA
MVLKKVFGPRKFCRQKAVYSTQVGCTEGFTQDPTYREFISDVRNNIFYHLSGNYRFVLI